MKAGIANFYSVEILAANLGIALGGSLHFVLFAPAASGIPPYSDNLRWSTKASEWGVKGMLPLGRLPLWGREGVTLIYTDEDLQVTGKRGFLQSRKMLPDQSDFD